MRNKGNPDTEQIRITIHTQTLKAGSKRARDKGMTLSAYVEKLLDAECMPTGDDAGKGQQPR